MEHNIHDRSISNFFENEYSDFAKYVILNRCCPSLIDGFKTGARKIMHAAFNGSLKNGSSVKLLNLTGDTLKLSLYPHGDSSLNSTIITLASDYKYNLNPLTIEGQHGTLRSQDASSPRYLYVKLSEYAHIFKEDYDLLEFVYDEGEFLEPKYYLPIIPTILTHMNEGMSPGYKYSCMSYSVKDIVNACIEYINTGDIKKTIIRPYLKDIKEENWIKDEDGWINKGTFSVKKNMLTITDLPYDLSWQSWEKLLNKYLDNEFIKDWKNFSESDNIKYIITLSKEIDEETLIKKFKLVKRVPNDSLWVVDENQKIKYFENCYDLIKYFCDFRLRKYVLRKEHLIKSLTNEIENNNQLCKFIKLVINNDIKIFNRPKEEIKNDMKKYNLSEALLNVSILKLTKEEYEKLLKETKKLQEKLDVVVKTSEKKMYLNDLSCVI